LIKRDISILAITANEPPIENLRDRQIRFDINCKAVNGELINVEMCLNPDPFEPIKLEFYAQAAQAAYIIIFFTLADRK